MCGLDFKNAFGSVPHETMWGMMERLDVPSHFLKICREIYSNSFQKVRGQRRASQRRASGRVKPARDTEGMSTERELPKQENYRGGTVPIRRSAFGI